MQETVRISFVIRERPVPERLMMAIDAAAHSMQTKVVLSVLVKGKIRVGRAVSLIQRGDLYVVLCGRKVVESILRCMRTREIDPAPVIHFTDYPEYVVRTPSDNVSGDVMNFVNMMGLYLR